MLKQLKKKKNQSCGPLGKGSGQYLSGKTHNMDSTPLGEKKSKGKLLLGQPQSREQSKMMAEKTAALANGSNP